MLMLYDLHQFNEAEARTMENILHAFRMGNRAHAYLLEGGSSSSRLKCGLYLACALVCEQKTDGRPCLACSQCRRVIENEHTDVKLLQPQEGAKDIKVEEIRELRRDVCTVPTMCEYHIYLLAECHLMNVNAQNALLKLLEEPPENTVFLLLAPAKELLLPTVGSRVQAHKLGLSSVSDGEKALASRYPQLPREVIRQAARLQRLADKTELKETVLRCLPRAYELVELYYLKKQRRLNEELPEGEEELLFSLNLLAAAARDIAVYKRNKNAEIFVFDSRETLQKAADALSLKRTMELYEAFSQAALRMYQRGNKSAVLTDLYRVIR